MADWQTEPGISDLYTAILTKLRDKDDALIKADYTGFTNLPTGAKRSNSSNSYKWERWSGSAWVALDFHDTIDAHIANTAIHSQGHIGALEFVAYSSPDTNFLLCDGTAVNRTTYASLFAKIGTTFGVGDGSTTFNLPNMKGRLPIGVDSTITAINAVGKTTGSFDHTHSVPAHTHDIATHTHTMANHTHEVGAHTHTIATHTHSVPAHFHYAAANGGDINITSSGTHTHQYAAREGGSDGSTADKPQGASSTSGSDATYTTSSTNSEHVHGAASFAGRVGNVGSGNNGDSGFNTGGSGTLTSNASTAFDSGAPSTNTTDGSGTLTTDSDGGGTSGSANPPVMAGWWQIRYAN